MNMMFDKSNGFKNSNPLNEGDYEIIPVKSLDEVVNRFSETENKGDYFLVRVKAPVVDSAEAKITVEAPLADSLVQAQAPLAQPPPFVKKTGERKEELSSLPQNESISAASPVAMPTSSSSGSAIVAPIDQDDIHYLKENAQVLLKAGEIDLARNIYRAILKSGEASDVAYAGLALCADRDGMVEQAIQLAWDSVAFAPNQLGYQILSQLLVQQGRDQEAASALARAIKHLKIPNEAKADYYKMMGNCYSRLGQNEEAEQAYLKALELNPMSDEVQSNLGSLFLEQGKMVEAKRCYQDAIASNQENDKAWVGLGLCYVSESDKEQAHDAFEKALHLNLRNSTAIFHLVKCAYEIKQYASAELILSKYVEVAPVSPSLLYSLAGLQFHVGKKREALLTAKRILQIKADHSGASELVSRLESES